MTSLDAVLAEFGKARLGFLAAGAGLSVFLLIISGLRLQLAIGAVGERLGLRNAIELVLCNQTAGLLGGGWIGGDMAGSSIGSKLWRKDMKALLAAAPLSRGIGVMGLLITGAGLFLLAGGSPGLQVQAGFEERQSGDSGTVKWFVLLIITAVLLHKGWRSFLLGILAKFISGLALIFSDPRLRKKALLTGVGVQLLQCGVTMLFLGAVYEGPFPWLGAAWTFVVIGAASMIPSVLGIGPREGAAVLLLAPYGVSEHQAVAAGLLCAVLGLSWGIIGGAILLLKFSRS
jgi:uncharacterized membrane protein YbhN (UPF0104 family)